MTQTILLHRKPSTHGKNCIILTSDSCSPLIQPSVILKLPRGHQYAAKSDKQCCRQLLDLPTSAWFTQAVNLDQVHPTTVTVSDVAKSPFYFMCPSEPSLSQSRIKSSLDFFKLFFLIFHDTWLQVYGQLQNSSAKLDHAQE